MAPRVTLGTMVDRWLRMVIGLALFAIAVVLPTSRYAHVIAAGGADHQTAEWLISYADGFVRRGLFGELFLRLTPGGSAGLTVLMLIQVGLWAVVVVYLLVFAIRQRFSWASLVLALGPAALAFAAWDPSGAFRKELLAYLALVLLGIGRGRPQGRTPWQAAGALVFVFAVFSWEASALFLPAVLWMLLGDDGDGKATIPEWSIATGVTVLAGVGVVLSMINHGDAETAKALCTAITREGYSPQLCTGAIRWMGLGSNEAYAAVLKDLPRGLFFAPLAVLGLWPVLSSRWVKRNLGWGLGMVAAILPLFVIAIDYGRWIHMAVMAIVLCIAASNDESSAESPLWESPLALVYLVAWGIPHAILVVTSPPQWLGFASWLGVSLQHFVR